MSVQILNPPQQAWDFGQQLNQTVNNLGQFFLQSAALRQNIKNEQMMNVYRQQQMQYQQQQATFARQKFAAEQADRYVARSPAEVQALEAQGFLPSGTSTKLPPGKETNPLVQAKVEAWGRVKSGQGSGNDFSFLNIDWKEENGKPVAVGKEATEKEPISSEKNPLKIVNPFTSQEEVVPYGQTFSKRMDDLIQIQSVSIASDVAAKSAQAVSLDLQKTMLDINQNVALGNVSNIRSTIGTLQKQIATVKETMQKTRSSLALFSPGTTMYNKVAADMAGYQNQLEETNKTISEAEGKLARAQDIAKTTAIATQIQALDEKDAQSATKLQTLIKKMWGQRVIKDEEAAQQIYVQYVRGNLLLTEAQQKELGQWLLVQAKGIK